MTSPLRSFLADDAVLRALVVGGCQDMSGCVTAFLPLLFAVAEHSELPLAEREDWVGTVMEDLCKYAPLWERSGLPARVWVAGIAQRRVQTLTTYWAAS